jgi:hypothetical protein
MNGCGGGTWSPYMNHPPITRIAYGSTNTTPARRRTYFVHITPATITLVGPASGSRNTTAGRSTTTGRISAITSALHKKNARMAPMTFPNLISGLPR